MVGHEMCVQLISHPRYIMKYHDHEGKKIRDLSRFFVTSCLQHIFQVSIKIFRHKDKASHRNDKIQDHEMPYHPC